MALDRARHNRLRLWLGGVTLVAAAAGVVRWTVLGSTTALPALIAVQVLHAFTFGATHLAAMHQIARTVPAAHGATAQSFYSSFAGGLTMAVAMGGSGGLYARVGGAASLAMRGVALGAGLALGALLTFWRAESPWWWLLLGGIVVMAVGLSRLRPVHGAGLER